MITNEIIEEFTNYISDKNYIEVIKKCEKKLLDQHLFDSKSDRYLDPIREYESIIEKELTKFESEIKNLIKRKIMIALCINLIKSLKKLYLPKSVMELYPENFEILKNCYIKNQIRECNIKNDFYCKDIRFVLGISIPCGAQDVDKIAKFSFLSCILSSLRSKRFYPMLWYLNHGAYGKWFRIHTDTRNLKDFNEDGWDRCYLRIVELLKRRKSIKGMVGTAWFYDPQIVKISPRLAYLQKNPIERGAFSFKHGISKIDIERATSKSKTRKRLYKEKKYIPVSYSILWHRKDMIEWAK